MLAEKLLLHVLIILAPVLIYSVLFENRRIGKSPYILGLLYSAAAFLCLMFSHYDYGLFWDLRYVPLVLSIFYGGPISGLMVVATILITRTYLGGDALIFGYFSVILSATVPFAFIKIYGKLQKRKRIWVAILLGFWPELIQLSVLFTHQIVQNSGQRNDSELMWYVLIFGIIQMLGIGFAARLHEETIERKTMKGEIQRAEKLNTLGELAASIAHEVRNPLTVVKGFLQLMQKEEKGQNYQYLTLVLSELGRAESIINDYLNFAKPQFEKVELVQLALVISEVIMLLQSLGVKQGVNLDSELDYDISFKTDKDQFKQALVNLIKNAIEATPQGGLVTVNLNKDKENVYLMIRDTGKGMTKEQLSRIGTLFYTTKDKGTGLGTTVSLKIIEAMNGKVSYKSEPDVGTEILITFPHSQQSLIE